MRRGEGVCVWVKYTHQLQGEASPLRVQRVLSGKDRISGLWSGTVLRAIAKYNFFLSVLSPTLDASTVISMTAQIVETISPMLLRQREEEEAALKSILDRQASVPSWWPAAQGSMTEDHYRRIRRAEKVLLREWRAITARRQATTVRP